MALVATVGSDTANSYVTVTEAEAYFATAALTTAWDSASTPERESALITATARLDQHAFVGVPVNSLNGTATGTTQALQWPRAYAKAPSGAYYLTTIIPEPIKRATYKLAYQLLASPTFLQPTGLEGFKRAKVGPIDVEPRGSVGSGELPDDVVREIDHLLDVSPLTFRMVRG